MLEPNPYGAGPSSIGDITDFFGGADASTAAGAYTDAANDLAKRTAEAQQAAIVTGAQQGAAGFKATAAQIEGDLSAKLTKVALLAGGVYALAKWKGWL